jgi:hypothetical protein
MVSSEAAKVQGATTAAVGRPLVPDALGLLTVYLVLLLAVPSSVRITALGSLGRPSLLWGVLIFGAWVLWRLQAKPGDLSVAGPPRRSALQQRFFGGNRQTRSVPPSLR